MALDDKCPYVSQPNNVITTALGKETINWTLFDDYGGGQFQVWANDTSGNFYVWQNWTIWSNASTYFVPINRSAPGIFNYTIIYNDSIGQWGVPQTVIVNITDEIPSLDNPFDIITTRLESTTIDWILYDDYGSGQFQVWANDTSGNFYVWQDWTIWSNASTYFVPINRSAPGIFNYTIMYNDSIGQWGVPQTVIVTIIDGVPMSNTPLDIITDVFGLETIDWTLLDDYGSGQFQVWANDTSGNLYVWQDWTAWSNFSTYNIPINRSAPGIFNYSIVFNDTYGLWGNPDTVIVTVLDLAPESNHPAVITTFQDEVSSIPWILTDDFGSGYYRVFINGTPGSWRSWENDTSIDYIIDTTKIGTFNYTIQFNSSTGQMSYDTVIVEIRESTGTPGNDLILYLLIIVIAGVVGVVGINRVKNRKGPINMFISHKSDDFKKYRIAEIAKFLEKKKEIGNAYYYEEDLVGNIDDWMKESVPLSEILLFIATEKSLMSKDCLNEINLAKENLIDIIPIKGLDISWEDLNKIGLDRMRGIPFSDEQREDDFDEFCLELHNYSKKFKEEMDQVQSRLNKSKISSIDMLSVDLNMDPERITKISKVLLKKNKISGAWTIDLKSFLPKNEILNRIELVKKQQRFEDINEIIAGAGIHEDYFDDVKKLLDIKEYDKKQDKIGLKDIKPIKTLPSIEVPREEPKPEPKIRPEAEKLEPETSISKPEPSIENRELKNKINSLETEIKQSLEQDNKLKAAQLMVELGEYYKQLGDNTKAEQILEYQRKLVLTELKQMRSNLVNQASKAEDEGNWQVARDSWAQCREISQKLYQDGLSEESENVKKFEDLEIKCIEELNKVSEPSKPSETVRDEETLKKEAMIKKFDDYIQTLNNSIQDLDNQFRAGQISQEFYLEKKNLLAEQIGEAMVKRDQLKG
jgi:hypothetical protein